MKPEIQKIFAKILRHDNLRCIHLSGRKPKNAEISYYEEICEDGTLCGPGNTKFLNSSNLGGNVIIREKCIMIANENEVYMFSPMLHKNVPGLLLD